MVKTIKIKTKDDVHKQFKFAKTELDATNEEALIQLLIQCSENDILEMVDEDVLKQRLQERY